METGEQGGSHQGNRPGRAGEAERETEPESRHTLYLGWRGGAASPIFVMSFKLIFIELRF